MPREWVKYSLMLQMAVAGVAIAADMGSNNVNQPGQTHRADKTMDTATPSDQAAQTGGAIDTNHKSITIDQTKQAPGTVRASKLLDSEVYTQQNKSLATIKDIVLDKNDRKVGYVVLSSGGVMGMGGKLCAVPYKLIQYNPSDPNAKIYSSIDEQTLKNAPTFSKDQWPTEANADYFKKAEQYYGGQASAANAKDTMKQMGEQAKESAKQTEHAMKQAAPDQGQQAIPAGARVDNTGLQWTRRVSELIGARVQSPNGDRLGDVKDLVLDWHNGDVRYAVLSYGGFMGVGNKLFAVPIDQFKIEPNGNNLVLDVNKDTLKNAPGFDASQWPNMADPNWDKDITQYYKNTQGRTNPNTNTNPGAY